MKFVILAVVILLFLPELATAQAPSNLVSLTVNSDGSSGRRFSSDRDDDSEDCHAPSGGTTCVYPEISIGFYPNGTRCCHSKWEPAKIKFQLEDQSANLGKEVFSPAQSLTFWGYVTTTNRSPNAGRAQSAYARLDVCMGANDTDAAIATNNATTCYNQYCGTSYNEYCNANSAAVCQDRCECSINGQTHSSCNQL
jgi:hypothetical protein